MSPRLYSFAEVLEAYRHRLLANPGTALDTGSGIVALLDPSGDVYGGLLHGSTGRVDPACAFDFDARSFRDGHWEDQTLEETLATLVSPKLIDLFPV
jgi:hypothetical protein